MALGLVFEELPKIASISIKVANHTWFFRCLLGVSVGSVARSRFGNTHGSVPCLTRILSRSCQNTLDETGCIHADIPPYADDAHSAGTTARLEPILPPERVDGSGSMAR
jgi:hypothetical protein